MRKQNQEDKILLQLIKEGDKKSFKKVFDGCFLLLFDFAQNLTNDRFQSDDIVQDTFIKLWNNRKNIDVNTSITNYLFKISYNCFVDQYRKNQRNQMLRQEWYFQKIVTITEENRFIKERKIEKLRKEIDQLPPKCKEIFVLSKFEGLKYREIGSKLNISIKTVENQMSIALFKLRKELRSVKIS